jgi:UDP-N-acetylglucosamine 1-carboxyvinyltransferase
LSGAQVMASDLRASAALVLAGLVAEGDDRSAPRLPHRPRLRAHRGAPDHLGAVIERVDDKAPVEANA